MNRFPPRLSFVLWALLFGAVLSQLGAPDLIIRVPWIVVWAALVLAVGLGARPLLDLVRTRNERFPEIYEDIHYRPACVGETIRLSERER